ncbi:hypothetical protein LGM65_21000 [Burkholderia anthina]|uniref:hypothetical protein n=1 Tax=Burkholderia anthina TaxID=179879 RepID=UPI001CF2BF58|nr:hypothetical protein [Burkholderia anthina]MCA8093333.1 hypothetical protein [Burkholderia anthina]
MIDADQPRIAVEAPANASILHHRCEPSPDVRIDDIGRLRGSMSRDTHLLE